METAEPFETLEKTNQLIQWYNEEIYRDEDYPLTFKRESTKLSFVEDAFRFTKTEMLKMRPIHARFKKEPVVMFLLPLLSYLMIKDWKRHEEDLI